MEVPSGHTGYVVATLVGAVLGATAWFGGVAAVAYGVGDVSVGNCSTQEPHSQNSVAWDGISNTHYGEGDLGSSGNGIWVTPDGPGITGNVCDRISSLVNIDSSNGNQMEAGWYWNGTNADTPVNCQRYTAKPVSFMFYTYNGGASYQCQTGTTLEAQEGDHVFLKVWDTSGSGNTSQTWQANVSTAAIGTQQGNVGSSYQTTNGERHGDGTYGDADFLHNQYWSRDAQTFDDWTTSLDYVDGDTPDYYPQCYTSTHTGASSSDGNNCGR